MKNKISVAQLNVSQASLLSGKTRETVSRAARDLQSANGAGNAKFFDSRKLLQALYLGVVGPTYSEAMRLLTLSRKDLIDHELEEKKAQTVPIEQYQRDFQHLIALFRASLLSRLGKIVDDNLFNSCQRDLIDYLMSVAEESERPALRKLLADKQLEEASVCIDYLKRRIAEDKRNQALNEAGERLRQAQIRNASDTSEEALAHVEEARDEFRAIADRIQRGEPAI
jgi:hypothetical protein